MNKYPKPRVSGQVIPVFGPWKISCNAHSWIVIRAITSKEGTEDIYSHRWYYSNLASALNRIIREEPRSADSLQDILLLLKTAEIKIQSWLKALPNNPAWSKKLL